MIIGASRPKYLEYYENMIVIHIKSILPFSSPIQPGNFAWKLSAMPCERVLSTPVVPFYP